MPASRRPSRAAMRFASRRRSIAVCLAPTPRAGAPGHGGRTSKRRNPRGRVTPRRRHPFLRERARAPKGPLRQGTSPATIERCRGALHVSDRGAFEGLHQVAVTRFRRPLALPGLVVAEEFETLEADVDGVAEHLVHDQLAGRYALEARVVASLDEVAHTRLLERQLEGQRTVVETE